RALLSSTITHLDYTLIFSIHVSVHHRDLHSFPTRRSSDLNAKSVFLVDKNGQLIASSGATDHIDTTSLASLTAGNIAATGGLARDRKSTRLNSSHVKISYAVFCLKKKKNSTTTFWRARPDH